MPPAPGYPAYRNILSALGIEVVEIELHGAGHLTAAHLVEAHRAKPLKGVLFASPANPTGAVIPRGDLEELLAAAGGPDSLLLQWVLAGVIACGGDASA